MKSDASPALNSLEQCNDRIKVAQQRAADEQTRLQAAYSKASRSAFEPSSPDIGPAEYAVQQQVHQNQITEARNALRNFLPARYRDQLLADDPRSKALLDAGLAHIRQLYGASLTPKPATSAPRKGIVARLESVLGAPVTDETPTFPPPRPLPVGGLFGASPKLDVPGEISRMERAIREWPTYLTFAEITARLNSVAAALRAEEPPKAAPVRMDVGFTPKHG